MKQINKRNLAAIVLVLSLCVLFLLPISLPYTIKGKGKVYPIKEWILEKEPNGGLVSTQYDHQQGLATELVSYSFERGDIARLQFDTSSIQRGRVYIGDTLAFIRSYELEKRLNALTQEIKVEKAKLINLSTGQKVPLIQEAKQQLAFAQEQFSLAKINFDRQKGLFESGAIAEQAFNEAENAYRLAGIQVNIAESSLAAAQIGEKPELIQLALARIDAAELELRFLNSKQNGYQVIAPLAGRFSERILPEQLIGIDDTSSWIISIPVQIEEQAWIPESANIQLTWPKRKEKLTASIISVATQAVILDEKQVVLVRAKLHDNPPFIQKGLLLSCEIVCDDLSLWQYLMRWMRF